MTVSRALSGSENVSPQTRQSVMEHALRIGYVKSSAASAMRGEPTDIVGLLLPNIINEFYARFANSLASLCADAGFDLVIHLTNDDYEQEASSLLRLQALQARTVIRVPAPRHGEDAAIHVSGLKMINLIRSWDDKKSVGSLMIDDGLSIKAAVDHLVQRGCRRIAYIGASEKLSSGEERLNAFQDAISQSEQGYTPEFVRTEEPSYEMGRDCMQGLLDAPVRPDALVCGGFEISNGALNACLTGNISMPDELAFIGYGNPSFYQWIEGGISTIIVPEDEVAHCAIDMLKGVGELIEPLKKVISTKLEIRRSG